MIRVGDRVMCPDRVFGTVKAINPRVASPVRVARDDERFASYPETRLVVIRDIVVREHAVTDGEISVPCICGKRHALGWFMNRWGVHE